MGRVFYGGFRIGLRMLDFWVVLVVADDDDDDGGSFVMLFVYVIRSNAYSIDKLDKVIIILVLPIASVRSSLTFRYC